MTNRLAHRAPLAATLAVCAVLLGGQAAAQDALNCDDFDSQFDAQTELNRTFPEDPNQLDADNDWIACEDFFELTDAEAARVIPADVVNRAPDTAAPSPAPAPARTPTPERAPPPAGPSVDPPAEVMARVQGCTVIAISSRSVAAAGCPGVGSIAFSIPRDQPRMRGRVIINPGAPFQDEQQAQAQRAAPEDPVERKQATRKRKKDRKRDASIDREQRVKERQRASNDAPERKRARRR